MTPPEPSSWRELSAWLYARTPRDHYPHLFDENAKREWTSVVQVGAAIDSMQGKHAQAIGIAAKNFADLGEDAANNLNQEARLCFAMRRYSAEQFVEKLASFEPEMIPFPTATFREILSWLLTDYWERWGRSVEADWFWRTHLDAERNRTTSRENP